MAYAAFFLSDLAITYYIGSRLRIRQPLRIFASSLVNFLVVVMVFLMGIRMGVNREVIKSLGTIGILAFTITVIVWIITIIGISIACRPLDISRFGNERT